MIPEYGKNRHAKAISDVAPIVLRAFWRGSIFHVREHFTFFNKLLGLEAVEAIIRIMESHSNISFGQPGPLVHFVERFYLRGYEEKLVESVRRKATVHTLWMLNRVINGTTKQDAKLRFIATMERAAVDPGVDQSAQSQARQFMERILRQGC